MYLEAAYKESNSRTEVRMDSGWLLLGFRVLGFKKGKEAASSNR